MKLISCHISNFGSITNQKFTFNQEGLTTFYLANGSGKSTLCAFIKAMLYGLDGIKANAFSDREHYFPFNGNTFGGNLIISFKGKIYRIERTFHQKKASEDTLKIYDDNNHELKKIDNKIIDNTFLLGDYLLGIDKNGFERCNYILANDLKFEINDTIKTKLNGLFFDYDKYNDFNTIIESINQDLKESRKNSLKYNNQISITDRIRKKIDDKNILLSNIKQAENNLLELDDVYKKYNEINKKKNKYEEKQIKISEYNAIKVKWEYIHKLEKNIQNNEDIKEKIINKYKFGLPNNDELILLSKYVDDLKFQNTSYQSIKLNYDEQTSFDILKRKYPNGIISNQDYDILSLNLTKINTINAQIEVISNDDIEKFNSLTNRFENNKIIDENSLKEKILKYNSLKNSLTSLNKFAQFSNSYPSEEELNSIKEKIELLSKEEKSIENFKIKKGFIRILLIIFTFGKYLKKEQQYYFKINKINNLKQEITTFFNKYNYDINNINESFYKLKIDLSSYLNEKNNFPFESFTQLENELKTYFLQFNYTSDIANCYEKYILDLSRFKDLKSIIVRNNLKEQQINALENENNRIMNQYHLVEIDLSSIREDISNYNNFISRINNIEVLLKTKKEIIDNINKILTVYHLEFNENNLYIIDEIKNDSFILNNCNVLINNDTFELNKYKKDNNLVKEDNDLLIESIDEVNKNISSLTSELNSLSLKIDEIEFNNDKIADYKYQIDLINKEIDELNNKINIIKIAKEIIEASEKEIEDTYIGPIKNKFEEYIKKIKQHMDFNVSISLDYKIFYDVNGSLKKYEYLSEGESCIILLALRFALIDNLYKDNDIFLILDDPLESLDEDNLLKIKEVIKEISQTKQIIYFTCHNSRIID